VTANRWQTANRTPLGPLIMIGQSETGGSSHYHIYYTLL
jgi:hypothetical protein